MAPTNLKSIVWKAADRGIETAAMYTKFYGLKGEPFLLTPDHRFYFESQVHGQAMAHLMYGLNRGEGFIVITGDVGAGKTTIVQRLCSIVDTDKVVPAHIVQTLLSGPELLRMACAAFGITDVPQEKDAVLRRLQAFFEQLGQQGHRALLVVDEAQNLSAATLEELRMLSNFQVGNVSPCQIFLVGQPQFRSVLTDPNLEQLRQRVIAAYHLGGLSREECARYVTHRMKQVGWTNDPVFQEDAMMAIYLHTGGIPRRINTLCSRVLLLGFVDQLHVLTGEHVSRVAADLGEEIGDMSAKANGHALSETDASSKPMSVRIDAVERELVLLRRISTSVGEFVLEWNRRHET
jgi:general secretion pathway protein A